MELTRDEKVQFEAATECGFRLEIVAGRPWWEFGPDFEHQDGLMRIASTLHLIGSCVAVPAVDLLFPDGSVVRPDLSVFQGESEPEGLVTLIPEAVVEIVSQRSREKDLKISPPWYLDMGVKDVLVYDPFTDDVHHFREGSHLRFKTGRTVALECGCLVDV